MRFAAIAVLAWGLFLGTANAESDLKSYGGEDAGILAISLSISYGDRAKVLIQRENSSDTLEISEKSGLLGVKPNESDPEPRGVSDPLKHKGYSAAALHPCCGKYLKYLRLPPGVYRITSLSVSTTQNGWQFSTLSGESIPFEVRTGEVTYLGQFEWLALNKGFWGPGIKGWSFSIIDRSERDLNWLRLKEPNVGHVNLSVPADWNHTHWIE